MDYSDVKKEDNIGGLVAQDRDSCVINEFTCQLIGQMSSISNINPSVLKPCMDAVNTFARRLISDTVFVTRRGMRCIPTASDMAATLKYHKLAVSFINAPVKMIPLKTTKTTGPDEGNVFYPEDPEVDLKELISKNPTAISYEPSLTEHWLSIYSVQPATPENPTPSYIHAQKKILRDKMYNKLLASTMNSSTKEILSQRTTDISKPNVVRGNLNGIALGFNGDRMPATVIDVRPHFVGTEHQVYFKTLTEACVGNDENARNNALMTIKNDKALDPLLPHLTHFIVEGIRLNILYQNLAVLIYLVRIVRSLVDNPHVNLDPYLHRLLPALLSVVLCGNICLNPITDNHFALRKFAGKVVNSICERQHTSRNELIVRLCEVLQSTIKQVISPVGDSMDNSGARPADFTMRLNTLCGSVLCLSEFSSESIQKCLLPRIGGICQFLTNIIRLKGSTLPGAEDKAISFLKDILHSNKIVSAFLEYRIANDLPVDADSCIKEFGNGMGSKYYDLFNKTRLSTQHFQQQPLPDVMHQS